MPSISERASASGLFVDTSSAELDENERIFWRQRTFLFVVLGHSAVASVGLNDVHSGRKINPSGAEMLVDGLFIAYDSLSGTQSLAEYLEDPAVTEPEDSAAIVDKMRDNIPQHVASLLVSTAYEATKKRKKYILISRARDKIHRLLTEENPEFSAHCPSYYWNEGDENPQDAAQTHQVTATDTSLRESLHVSELAVLLENNYNHPWMLEARCLDADPEAFFPDRGGSTEEAKAICDMCPVRSDCLEYAVTNDIKFGIWGGTSVRERRRLRRLRKKLVS